MTLVGEKKVGEELLPGYACPQCGHRTIYLQAYDVRYEVLGIPMFRATTITKVDCISCVYNLEVKLRDPDLKQIVRDIRRTKGFNYFNFIGTLILAVLMTGLMVYLINRPVTKPEFASRILKGKQDQEFAIYSDSAKYVIWKTVQVKSDTLWMVESKESTPVRLGLSAIRGHGFDLDTFLITVDQLNQLLRGTTRRD